MQLGGFLIKYVATMVYQVPHFWVQKFSAKEVFEHFYRIESIELYEPFMLFEVFETIEKI